MSITTKTVAAIPLTALEPFEGRRMDGILGYDVIGQFVVRIDYAAKRLDLYDPTSFSYSGKGERVPFEFVGRTPHVRASVRAPGREPVEGLFTVDTGARSALSLTRPFVQGSWLRELAEKALAAPHGIGVGGEMKSKVGRVATFRLGGFEIERPVVGFDFDERGAGANRDIAGNLGGEILRRFTVTFDYSRREMILEPNAAFAEPFEYDMFGALMKFEGAAFRVHRVIDGSPAREAGLAVGDLVTGIDGKPLGELTLEQVRRHFREPGRVVEVTVRRGSEELRVRVTLRRLV